MRSRTLYKIFGVLWDIKKDYLGDTYVCGPYCGNCRYELTCTSNNSFHCNECNKTYSGLPDVSPSALEGLVLSKFEASELSEYEVISLDEPPSRINARDEDDRYFVAVKMGQKDGKRVGVVYFGEKMEKQGKKDYSQLFIDLDDEQVRFDKSNKPPKDILARFTVEFPHTVVENKFGISR